MDKIYSMRSATIFLLAIGLVFSSCDQLAGVIGEVPTNTGTPPTKSEIASGIREALIVGARNSIEKTSKTNGFYGNNLIKIPFPPEAQQVEKTARDLGLDKQVDNFVETLNRGAEQASAKAQPIFVNAIKKMTLQDVYDIWRGSDDAATQYLRKTTLNELKQEFRPVIKSTLNQVELTKHWNPLVTAYNRLPMGEKVNPDLDEYVLEESLDGLFLMIAKEEEKIRENPRARTSEILEKVFGYLDNRS